MSTMAWDWAMFASGVLALCFVVWLQRARRGSLDAPAPLKRSRLGGFCILGGCLLGLQDLLEFGGRAEWGATVAGLVVGAGMGVAAGRWWVQKGGTERVASRSPRLSRFLRSWGFQVFLLVALFLVATVMPGIPAALSLPLVAVSLVPTGFFLALGISLAASGARRSHDRRSL